MSRSTNSFDRLRPRSPQPTPASPTTTKQDTEGKRLLYSRTPTVPQSGLVVECSRCGERTVVSSTHAVRALLPSVHLPVLRRRYPSWARCPRCGKYAWVKLSIKL